MFGNSKAVWNLSTVLVMAVILLIAAGQAQADLELSEPVNLGSNVNGTSDDIDSSISSDGLSLYFGSRRSSGFGGWDIWVTTRETTDDEWGPARNLGSTINTSSTEGDPRISADGLTLFLISDRSGGYGGVDIWAVTRETTHDEWSAPVNLGSTVNSSAFDGIGSISPDGLTLNLFSDRPGGYGGWDMYQATWETKSEAWGVPVNIGPTVNSSSMEGNPCVLADGRTLIFSSDRAGGFGRHDLYVTTQSSQDNEWSEPINLGPTINSPVGDELPSVWHDGSTIYFSSNRANGNGWYDLWQFSFNPVVDFTGDYRVDIDDLTLLIQHWGQNEPAYDMGPMPWGDGVVDKADLEVLMSYYGQELYDPHFLAHWKLDEEAGKIAYDSVGTNDGVIIGSPQWRLEDGAVDGALELNGTTFIAFDPVLNPADGPFSVLVWVKGGGPGQVVASSGRTNWLMADVATGALMTELSNVGQNGGSLGPEAVITDGNWHRIAFTWDGANARLYVDTLLVAECTQDGLVNSSARLLLGTSIDREPDTYWSGLIDDVRIFNRAVNP